MKDVITFGGSGFLDSLAMLGPCPSSSARYLRDSLTNLLIALKLHLLLLLDSRISANNFSPLPKQLTSNTYSCNPMTHPPIKLVLESLFTKKRYSSGYLHITHLHPHYQTTNSPPPETARLAGGTPTRILYSRSTKSICTPRSSFRNPYREEGGIFSFEITTTVPTTSESIPAVPLNVSGTFRKLHPFYYTVTADSINCSTSSDGQNSVEELDNSNGTKRKPHASTGTFTGSPQNLPSYFSLTSLAILYK